MGSCKDNQNQEDMDIGRTTKPSQCGAVYRLTQKIGEGKYGIVFKGYNIADTSEGLDPSEVEPLAIKFLKGDQKEIAARMLRREVALQAKLRSLHLANVEDYRTDAEQPYLVMEYVPETLFGLFCRNVINQEVIINLIRQTPCLLKDFLTAGVVHLDLKPNNIGYQGLNIGAEIGPDDFDDCSIIALDYGLALLLPPSGHGTIWHTGTAETLPYSAPEFVQIGEVNKSTDTYAMGKTMEWLLTGALSQSLYEFGENILSYHGVRPPQSLLDMHAAMTAPDPSARPSPEQLERIASLVAAELERKTTVEREPFLFGAKSIRQSLAPVHGEQYARDWSSADAPTSSDLRVLERELLGMVSGCGSLEE